MGLRSEISESHTKTLEIREKHFEETVYKKADMNRTMQELVKENKARIARSDECARDQTLTKIRHTKEKMDMFGAQQKQVENYRTNALRDEMIGRTQLNELKKVMQEASP